GGGRGPIHGPPVPGGVISMKELAEFDRRPIIVAIAGPNGAGKTTCFHTHLARAGLRFVNVDVLAAELATELYEAARLADALRRALVARRESFVFETVFADPVGDKVASVSRWSGAITSSPSSFGRVARRWAWRHRILVRIRHLIPMGIHWLPEMHEPIGSAIPRSQLPANTMVPSLVLCSSESPRVPRTSR